MRIFIIILILSSVVSAQIAQSSSASDLFHRIENGIRAFSVDEFEMEFGSVISLSIGTGEGGKFSANQAISILRRYFSERRYISFTFSRVNDRKAYPYATGRLVFVHKGNQESAQIYVSLTMQDSRWVIDQFNIY